MKLSLLILVLALMNSLPGFSREDCQPAKKVIREASRLFGEASSLEINPLRPDRESLSHVIREKDCIFGILKDGEVLGYILSTRAKGRFEYFDYSVIYAQDLAVLGVMVTVYRSTHGAGICQKKWLQQFVGYQGGELSLGKDIDAISGATFSTTALVEDIQRCQQLMLSLKKNPQVRLKDRINHLHPFVSRSGNHVL